jgi:hypothetical protein
MPRPIKPDPYNGFKDDRERRLALNAKVRSRAAALSVAALCGAHMDWMEIFRWFAHWPH